MVRWVRLDPLAAAKSKTPIYYPVDISMRDLRAVSDLACLYNLRLIRLQ